MPWSDTQQWDTPVSTGAVVGETKDDPRLQARKAIKNGKVTIRELAPLPPALRGLVLRSCLWRSDGVSSKLDPYIKEAAGAFTSMAYYAPPGSVPNYHARMGQLLKKGRFVEEFREVTGTTPSIPAEQPGSCLAVSYDMRTEDTLWSHLQEWAWLRAPRAALMHSWEDLLGDMSAMSRLIQHCHADGKEQTELLAVRIRIPLSAGFRPLASNDSWEEFRDSARYVAPLVSHLMGWEHEEPALPPYESIAGTPLTSLRKEDYGRMDLVSRVADSACPIISLVLQADEVARARKAVGLLSALASGRKVTKKHYVLMSSRAAVILGAPLSERKATRFPHDTESRCT